MPPGASSICKHQGPRVLLVEGRDDCHVVMSLCQAHDVPETFGIYSCGSDDKMLKRLNALISQSEPTTVIRVVLDADRAGVENRWKSIRGKLSHYPYNFTERTFSAGTIVEPVDRKPKLGFWLMPDNSRSGMLEDFCIELAEPEGAAFAGQCVEDAQAHGMTSFKKAHHSKAVIHTYLAWQDEPGRPLGQAITAQALRPDSELARQFSDWLKDLFSPNRDSGDIIIR